MDLNKIIYLILKSLFSVYISKLQPIRITKCFLFAVTKLSDRINPAQMKLRLLVASDR